MIYFICFQNPLAIHESWVTIVHNEIDNGRLRYRDQLNTTTCSTQAATYFVTNSVTNCETAI